MDCDDDVVFWWHGYCFVHRDSRVLVNTGQNGSLQTIGHIAECDGRFEAYRGEEQIVMIGHDGRRFENFPSAFLATHFIAKDWLEVEQEMKISNMFGAIAR